jgi:hypothetical protein
VRRCVCASVSVNEGEQRTPTRPPRRARLPRLRSANDTSALNLSCAKRRRVEPSDLMLNRKDRQATKSMTTLIQKSATSRRRSFAPTVPPCTHTHTHTHTHVYAFIHTCVHAQRVNEEKRFNTSAQPISAWPFTHSHQFHITQHCNGKIWWWGGGGRTRAHTHARQSTNHSHDRCDSPRPV